MATLQAAQLADLLTTTLKELGEMKWTDISSDLQKHVAMRNLMRKNRVVLDSGTSIQWNLMVGNSGAARATGLYGTDNVNVGEVMKTAEVPWRHYTTNYAFDRREIAMNRTPRRLVDLMKIRRIDCMTALAELWETDFWTLPTSTDTVSMYGVPYYVVKSATAASKANANGFNGGAPSGYSAGTAGLSSTTYPRWSNYSDAYTNISKDDLIRKWRRAATMTDFTPPVDGTPTYSTGDSLGWYSSYPVVAGTEELLEAQNDDLGTDIASMDGKTLFRRVGLTWVPKLDNDTDGPIYGINWGYFKIYVLRGEWLNETKIDITPGQHTVASVHVDSSLNPICKDRRRQVVLSTGTSGSV